MYSSPLIIQPLIIQTLGYLNSLKSNTTIKILYVGKFPRYVNFADFTVTYGYGENLIRENLLVCNN